MDVITVPPKESRRWDEFVARWPEFLLMQGHAWGEFKRARGWEVVRLAVERDGRWVGGAQLLIKPLLAGRWSLAYVPRGPLVAWDDPVAVHALLNAVHAAARRRRAIFLKMEPPVRYSPEAHRRLLTYGFRPSKFHNQPRSTLVISLTDDESAILSRMHRKTRRNIRLGLRDVVVEEGQAADLDAFYRLLQETARRARFSIRSPDYYRQEWNALAPAGLVKLFLARYRGKVVAARLPALFGRWAATLHSGSSVAHRKLKLNEPLMWAGIRWAKSQGCLAYDLWGIPDAVGAHVHAGRPLPAVQTGGLWGVYRFKRGFGGEVVYYVGAYDFVYAPTLYRLVNLVWGRLGSLDRAARLGDWLLGRRI